ncbi:MAG: S41 family peptidase [Oscillibacter sp.]
MDRGPSRQRRGLTSAAVSALGAFSGEGDLTYFVDQDGESTAQSYSGKDLTDKPAIVLMDSGSASASEILRAACSARAAASSSARAAMARAWRRSYTMSRTARICTATP